MENENDHVGYYFVAGVQKTGKSMYALGLAAKQAAKSVKFFNRVQRATERLNRVKDLRWRVQDVYIAKDPERLCRGCELEGTFCEGRRCEDQAEIFFENDMGGRDVWKAIIYDVIGDEYYNLSLKNKVQLLKDLS